MRKVMHRHLGKVVAGAAVAITATAVLIGVTLPGSASGEEGSGGGPQSSSAEQGQAARQQPGVVEDAPEQRKTGSGRDPLTDDEMKRAQSLGGGGAGGLCGLVVVGGEAGVL
ncbi:hypothetical protein [Streptomyces sp. NPDC059455]|uniref:hypothetical protein n=1 Tax=Streptomyces sp. NPDC059455 TaxID=3346837 RepID=UPI003690B381